MDERVKFHCWIFILLIAWNYNIMALDFERLNCEVPLGANFTSDVQLSAADEHLRLNFIWSINGTVVKEVCIKPPDSSKDIYCLTNFSIDGFCNKDIKNKNQVALISNSGNEIKADCPYKIQFWDGSSVATCIYKVPDCQLINGEQFCHCRGVTSIKVITNTESVPEGVKIFWQLPLTILSPSEHISQVVITLNGSDVNRNQSIPLSNETSGWVLFNVPRTNYEGYVDVYDKRRPSCITRTTFKIIDTSRNVLLTILSTVGTILGVVGILGYLVIRFKGNAVTDNTSNSVSETFLPSERSKKVWITVSSPFYFTKENREISEIDISRLTFGKKLGEGNFGKVYLGKMWDISEGNGNGVLVAIKKPKSMEVMKFQKEIDIHKKVGYHKNIVQMLGYCNHLENVYLILEFVDRGDLLSYLRRLRTTIKGYPKPIEDENYVATSDIEVDGGPSPPYASFVSELDHKELQAFALQIAQGMSHLEEKGIVHRDLAARNILIDRSKTLKISDFGMAKETVYINEHSNALPIKWMAPETFLGEKKHTIKSDVWSFAVVLWEIGTLGAQPYSNIEACNMSDHLRSGLRLQQHKNISNHLFKLMQRCWHWDPELRPSFLELVQKLGKQEVHIYVDFSNTYVNLEDYELPPCD